MFLKGWSNKTAVLCVARYLLWKCYLDSSSLWAGLKNRNGSALRSLAFWSTSLLQEQARRGGFTCPWVSLERRVDSHLYSVVYFLWSKGEQYYSESEAEVGEKLGEKCWWDAAQFCRISSWMNLCILISLFQYHFLIFILGQDQSCVSYYWCN